MRRMVALLTLAAMVAGAATPLHEDVAIIVEHGTVSTAPAWIRLRVVVEPQRDNRELWVGIESDDFSTSHYEQLEGEASPRTRWVEIKDVPRGEYTAFAQVDRVGGKQLHAAAPFIVN